MSENEAICLSEERFRTGRFFASDQLLNVTACPGFRAKNRGVKQILKLKYLPKKQKY
jgi:hypothetical protein